LGAFALRLLDKGRHFDVGGFCRRIKIAEGKRIANGELLANLRAKTLRKLKKEHGTVQVCMENFIYRL
jgi:hypothetical protein